MELIVTETDDMLAEIALTLRNDKQSANTCKATITSVANELVGLEDKYSARFTQLNADVAANPGDEYLAFQKTRKDKYLTQWQALRDAAVLLKTAADGVAIP